MGEKNTAECWSCPKRTGLSKLAAQAVCKFWGRNNAVLNLKNVNEFDCAGPVPTFVMRSPTTIVNTTEGDQYVATSSSLDAYQMTCAKDADPEDIESVPVEVRSAMRVNHLSYFTAEKVTRTSEPLADFEARVQALQTRLSAGGLLDPDAAKRN